MYQCQNFTIEELVPKATYTKYGAKCWLLFDDRLLFALDCLRGQFGLTTINTWINGGVWEYRGWRPPEYVNKKAPLSQHFFGRAADMNFRNHSAESVREWLKLHYRIELLGQRGCVIKRIENGTSWLHIDVGNTDSSDILFFDP